MAKQETAEKATTGSESPSSGADQGYSAPPPTPSPMAATAAGAVGPGALAAAETAIDERTAEAESGLTQDDRAILRGLVRRVGGVDALIRWLEQHRDLP
jgi:hypothetical protein